MVNEGNVTFVCRIFFLDEVAKRFVRDPSESEFAMTFKGLSVEYDLSTFVPAEVKAGKKINTQRFFDIMQAAETAGRSC